MKIQKFKCIQNNNNYFNKKFTLNKEYEGVILDDYGLLITNDENKIIIVSSPFTKNNINTTFELVKEDEFTLPKTWYIKVTKENKDILNKFKLSKGKNDIYYNMYVLYEAVDNKGYGVTINYAKKFNYKEITFDQFKKYVLKENIDIETKEIFTKEQEDKISEMIDKAIKQLQ